MQVLGKAYEILAALVSQASSVSKRDAFTALGGTIDKLSDAKLRAGACGLLDALAEAVGPQFVAAQLHKKAAAHKSPKVSGPSCNLFHSKHDGLLDALAEAVGLQFVAAQLHRKAAAHKSPKVLTLTQPLPQHV